MRALTRWPARANAPIRRTPSAAWRPACPTAPPSSVPGGPRAKVQSQVRGKSAPDVGTAQPDVLRRCGSATARRRESMMRLVTAVREASFLPRRQRDDDDAGEGWRFIQLEVPERACAVSCCSTPARTINEPDDLDWIALLASCAAFDSSKGVHGGSAVDRIAELLLVPRSFMLGRYSVTHAVSLSHHHQGRAATPQILRIIRRCVRRWTSRRCRSSGRRPAFLNGVLEQCRRTLHAAVHDALSTTRSDRVPADRRCSTPSPRPVPLQPPVGRAHGSHAPRGFPSGFHVPVVGEPGGRIFGFVDHMGNQVHHFDLPSHHAG